jgi:hypothetical protein
MLPVLPATGHGEALAGLAARIELGRFRLSFVLTCQSRRGAMSETRKLAAILVADVVG